MEQYVEIRDEALRKKIKKYLPNFDVDKVLTKREFHAIIRIINQKSKPEWTRNRGGFPKKVKD